MHKRLKEIETEFIELYDPVGKHGSYTLNTPIGNMSVLFDQKGLQVIYTRFDSPTQAKYYVPCNVHSGKHNYYGDLDRFLNDLKRIFQQ